MNGCSLPMSYADNVLVAPFPAAVHRQEDFVANKIVVVALQLPLQGANT